MSRKLLLAIALTACIGAGLYALLRRAEGPPPPEVGPRETPVTSGVETGDPSTLTLYHAGERIGYLEPCGCDEALVGGLPRGKSVMQAAGGGPAIFLENGDLNDDVGEQDRLKYAYQIRALQQTGCDVYNIGEKDLTLGLPFLIEKQSEAGFPFLSANLRLLDGGSPFPSSTRLVRRVGGVDRRILVIGALADSLAPYVDPGSLSLQPAGEAIREAVRTAEDPADLSVLLFHGDLDEAREAVRGADGIDLVISTCHEGNESYEVTEGGLPPIVCSGLKGKTLGRIPVSFTDAGAKIGSSDPVTLTSQIPDSPEIVPILREYYAQVKTLGLIDDVALEDPQEGGLYVGSAKCGECHVDEYESWKGTAHHHALETLKEKGREADPECVECHVVGFRYVSGFSNAEETPSLGGVGCESCHGVGGLHAADPQRGYGYAGGEKSCLGCHNPERSPRFDFSTAWPKIVHTSE